MKTASKHLTEALASKERTSPNLPPQYQAPDVAIFSAEQLQEEDMRLVAGTSPLSEEGDYYY